MAVEREEMDKMMGHVKLQKGLYLYMSQEVSLTSIFRYHQVVRNITPFPNNFDITMKC